MSKITKAIAAANDENRLALAAFLTAGFPDKDAFANLLPRVATAVDVLEVGVPFSDPMADGVSIQHASHVALRHGVNLPWIFDVVASVRVSTPVVFMSYLNPLLAFGIENLGRVAERAGVSGFIVPDLPYEEALPVHRSLQEHGVELIQLVTPTTPSDRLEVICKFSQGFVYAVTMTGTTGGAVTPTRQTIDYLDRVRQSSITPVMAGFGIREPKQIAPFGGHVNGIIVGSALMDLVRAGTDPLPFIDTLRKATLVKNEALT